MRHIPSRFRAWAGAGVSSATGNVKSKGIHVFADKELGTHASVAVVDVWIVVWDERGSGLTPDQPGHHDECAQLYSGISIETIPSEQGLRLIRWWLRAHVGIEKVTHRRRGRSKTAR